jgi:hypothetical protein
MAAALRSIAGGGGGGGCMKDGESKCRLKSLELDHNPLGEWAVVELLRVMQHRADMPKVLVTLITHSCHSNASASCLSIFCLFFTSHLDIVSCRFQFNSLPVTDLYFDIHVYEICLHVIFDNFSGAYCGTFTLTISTPFTS